MKFSNRTGTPDGIPGEMHWSSDCGKCLIDLFWSVTPAGQLESNYRFMSVRISIGYARSGQLQVSCDTNGVGAFVVKELMDIVEGCVDESVDSSLLGELHPLLPQLMVFMRALRPEATFGRFHAYKEKQKNEIQ